MKWFGEDWGALVCKTTEHADVPIAPCFVCGQLPSRGLLIPSFIDGLEYVHCLECMRRIGHDDDLGN